MITEQEVRDVLNTIIDPCSAGYIPAGIVDFGLVRDVQVDNGDISVTIGVTEPGCPVGLLFVEQARTLLTPLAAGGNVDVQVDLTGMWTEEMFSSHYRSRLQQMRVTRQLPIVVGATKAQ